MSFNDERRAIQSRMNANFTALPVRYENQPFVRPDATPWVDFQVLRGEGRRASIGITRPLHRYAGVIQATIHVKEDSGTGTTDAHADTIEAIFRDVQFSAGNSGTITCRTPTAVSLGVDDGWHRTVVSVAYHRDRFFT